MERYFVLGLLAFCALSLGVNAGDRQKIFDDALTGLDSNSFFVREQTHQRFQFDVCQDTVLVEMVYGTLAGNKISLEVRRRLERILMSCGVQWHVFYRQGPAEFMRKAEFTRVASFIKSVYGNVVNDDYIKLSFKEKTDVLEALLSRMGKTVRETNSVLFEKGENAYLVFAGSDYYLGFTPVIKQRNGRYSEQAVLHLSTLLRPVEQSIFKNTYRLKNPLDVRIPMSIDCDLKSSEGRVYFRSTQHSWERSFFASVAKQLDDFVKKNTDEEVDPGVASLTNYFNQEYGSVHDVLTISCRD